MNIAELFVNLGIKGADKTVGALGSVKKGLGEVSSMSLEAKAGIVAAMYGLEQMMAKSGAAGTGLTNFAALTGLSSRTLQEWEYAARQAGLSGEELTGSLKSVQNSMSNMLMGKGAPEGLAIVKRAVGFDMNRVRDTFYVMQQLQKAAQALPKDVGNNIIKSFGISEGTIAAMRRNAFSPNIMGKAPAYSDKEINSLDRSNIAWSNLGNKIEMAFGHFNAKHGQQLVGDISKITDQVLRLVEAFEQLAEKLKLFGALARAAEVTADIFQGWGLMVDDITGKGNYPKQHAQLPAGLIAPNIDPTNQGYHSITTINQNIVHHGDAKDTKSVKDTHNSAANHAYRQRDRKQGA